MTSQTAINESEQGRLWGSAPRDWAESERRQAPTYEASGEGPVASAVAAAAAPHRAPDGSIRLENEWHHLIARA